MQAESESGCDSDRYSSSQTSVTVIYVPIVWYQTLPLLLLSPFSRHWVAGHAGDLGSIPGPNMLYFRCKNLALKIRDCISCWTW